ncbi:uncharacterized protein IWZ02DRAFT_308243 [Phyllosticta citriasiana]|uniref:uncharacterized protein n=1 Tax=Phyllosticta citriasiana TaxID=595635 RepID=UPI0030FD7C5B
MPSWPGSTPTRRHSRSATLISARCLLRTATAAPPVDVATLSDLGAATPRVESRASSPACEAYHKDASELATDYWAPGARDCQDFRSRYGIHLLDPDMLGYLAEMNALRDDVVNAPWFSAYVNNTSSKPLKLGCAWEDPTNTECAIMCVSSDVYAALVDMQLLRKQYMPKSDWFLCDVMRTQFERTHGSLDKTPDCLLVNTQTDIAIAEFDRYNPWCEKPKHDFSSLRHREVNGNWW